MTAAPDWRKEGVALVAAWCVAGFQVVSQGQGAFVRAPLGASSLDDRITNGAHDVDEKRQPCVPGPGPDGVA